MLNTTNFLLYKILDKSCNTCNRNDIENREIAISVYKNFEDYKTLNAIITNDKFCVEYNPTKNKFELKTTFSNLNVDTEFMNELNILNELVIDINNIIIDDELICNDNEEMPF